MTTDAVAQTVTPTAERRWSEAVDDYVRARSLEVLTPRYLQEIRRVLTVVGAELSAGGSATSPSGFGEAQLSALLRGSLSPARVSGVTRAYVLCILRGFLLHEGNPFLTARRTRGPKTAVRPILALDAAEASRVLELAEGAEPWLTGMVALEATMGLRRSEALRLRASDLDRTRGVLTFVGKGRWGGKARSVPMSERFTSVLPRLLEARRLESTSSTLLGRWIRGAWRPIIKTVADRGLRDLYDQAGLVTPYNLHHALRRTFGRSLWARSVPLEVIARLLGHEDTRMTIRYLALQDADLRGAMAVSDQVWRRP